MKGGGERRRLAHLGKVFNKAIKSSRRCPLFYTKLQILLLSRLGCNGSRRRQKMLVLSFGYAIFNFIVILSCIYPKLILKFSLMWTEHFFFKRDRCCLMSTSEFESRNFNNWEESSKSSYSEYCSQFMSVSQNVLDLFLIGWWVFVQIKQQENSDTHSTLLSLASTLSRPFHLLVKTINSKLNGCGLGLRLLFFHIKQVFTTQTWIFMINFQDE